MGDHDPRHGALLSRRNAAKYVCDIALAAGVAALGFFAVAGKARAGYGACTFNGCPCLGFHGQGENCTNCGHLFSVHEN